VSKAFLRYREVEVQRAGVLGWIGWLWDWTWIFCGILLFLCGVNGRREK